MQFLRSIGFLFIVSAFSFTSLLSAKEEVQERDFLENSTEASSLSELVTYSRKTNKQDSGKTYVRFPSITNFQSAKSVFFQTNIGVGLLYFSGLRGNLMGRPVVEFQGVLRDAPIKGRLSYNRSPLFEYLVGYQLNSWLKLALSYQYQGSISIITKRFRQSRSVTGEGFQQLSANLNLNAVLAKVYFELPFAMIWRSLSTNPYLALGVGPGWQSWTQIKNLFYVDPDDGGSFQPDSLNIRQKISANAVWMVDLGLRVQSAYPNSKFSVLLGCKYNQWGQARSMGKMSQQGSYKWAFSRPVAVKTVYQFAPYLGVQWSF